ncbi:MAG: hydrogenase formation HypD protein [Herbinix sp.]|jgi:hydrogenase expression/formation protein HypD|nr:hydrogenase formation HypD protein [Herbinix sp.]
MTLEQIKDALLQYEGPQIKIMEVCGTHTGSIFKSGIRSLLSSKIKLISGPGCPVCVTSSAYIDRLVDYALQENCCVLTFGDMMKVKGNKMSLTEAKAIGAKVQILYSPLAAIQIAKEEANTQFVFAAVGFETTTPIYALMLEEMIKDNIENLKLMTSIKATLPALAYICENEKGIDAFICPGHVSVITGSAAYEALAEKYQKPFVIAGFEGEHILAAIYEIIQQVKNKKPSVKNLYKNAVSEEGNLKALAMVDTYFEETEDHWRGIGVIETSALQIRQEYKEYDAGSTLEHVEEKLPKGCKCTEVILGRINPVECPLFSKVCTPFNAVGPCMVSVEGACGIWYKNLA